jgi:drug/metabolite transporter (DMT)-like permease
MPGDTAVAALAMGGILGAAGAYLYYRAVKIGHVSVVTVVAASQIIWVVIMSFFLFDEKLSALQYISIFVIFIGIALAVMEKLALPAGLDEKSLAKYLKSGVLTKGAGLALVVSFCWAFLNVCTKYGVQSVGSHMTMVYVNVLMLVLILLAFLARPAKELVTIPKLKEFKWLGPAGLIFAVGHICFYFGLKYVPLSVIVPITSSSAALTAVAAAAFVKERVRVHQYAGIVLAVVGIVFLSL